MDNTDNVFLTMMPLSADKKKKKKKKNTGKEKKQNKKIQKLDS